MKDVFYDIIPHSSGWLLRLSEEHSRAYPSRHLAVQAAQDHKRVAPPKVGRAVIRLQDLKGVMREVPDPSQDIRIS